MRRFMFMFFLVTALCLGYASSVSAEGRYNPDDWQYALDDYGGNCYAFVNHVCLSEDRGALPAYCNGMRELTGETPIAGGQWLNEEHDNTGPSSANVKELFPAM